MSTRRAFLGLVAVLPFVRLAPRPVRVVTLPARPVREWSWERAIRAARRKEWEQEEGE